MTTAAGCRSLFRRSVTPNTTIVKCPFGHNLIKVSILRIPRIAIFAMMAYVGFVQFGNASGTNGVMTTRARRALFCLVCDCSVRAYERFVSRVVEEDHSASSLLVKPDNFLRTSAVCLLVIRGAKHCGAHGHRYRQPQP